MKREKKCRGEIRREGELEKKNGKIGNEKELKRG